MKNLDERCLYCNNKVFIITSEKLYSLISTLNSNLGKFLAKLYCVPLGKSGYEYRKIFIEKIPILIVSLDTEKKLKKFAINITEKKKELNELIVSANQLLSKEYNLEKELNISELGWNEFIEQFEKQKIKLTLDQKEELQKWFRKKQNELQKIQDKINELDNKIDKEVYKLYGLSEEEIKIVEEGV